MKISVEITKASYNENYINRQTNERQPRITYVGIYTDNEGYRNPVTFVMSGEKMMTEKVRVGDHVFVRITLGLKDYNGAQFNRVRDCYFISRDESFAPVRPAVAAAPADALPEPFQTSNGESTDLPFD